MKPKKGLKLVTGLAVGAELGDEMNFKHPFMKEIHKQGTEQTISVKTLLGAYRETECSTISPT